MTCNWKPNWDETREHFRAWWNHEGPLISFPYIPASRPIPDIQNPGPADSIHDQHTDSTWIAGEQKYRLARRQYLGDTLPIAAVDIGYLSLSLYLGGTRPIFKRDTVWYEPLMGDIGDTGHLTFDPLNPWFQNHRRTYEETVASAQGHFLIGTPGLGCNIDVLSAVRGQQSFMIDLIDRPEWVKEKLEEINQAYFQAFDALYKIYRLADGSSCASYYGWWSPGKVSLVMAEAASMISSDMFAEFVCPFLAKQCGWLDHSVYLIDGRDCLRFTNHLLEIPELDAIAFDPGPHGAPGDDPVWFDLYRQVLSAGKSIQVYSSDPDRVFPLFDQIGSAGVCVVSQCRDQRQAEDLLEKMAWNRASHRDEISDRNLGAE